MSERHPSRSDYVPPVANEIAEPSDAERRYRHHRAAELLRRWSAEEDGYDDEIHSLLEKELKDYRMVIG